MHNMKRKRRGQLNPAGGWESNTELVVLYWRLDDDGDSDASDRGK